MSKHERRIIMEEIDNDEYNDEESNFGAFNDGFSKGLKEVSIITPIIILLIIIIFFYFILTATV